MNILVPTTILTCLLGVFLGVITQMNPAYKACIDKCADKPGENKSTCGTTSYTKRAGAKSFVRLRNECEVTCMSKFSGDVKPQVTTIIDYTVEPLVVCCPPPYFGANCTWIYFRHNSTKAPKKKN